MTLSEILKEEDKTVRHVLLTRWQQDQDGNAKLEPQKQHTGIRVKACDHLLETAFKKVT
jgi:hypothetical protein